MYYLKTESSFDAVHFLKDYDGRCANMHGHRWRVVAEISGDDLIKEGPAKGMVLDFSDYKRDLRALCDSFDHLLIYEEGSLMDKTLNALSEEGFLLKPVPFRPTAEHFARHIFDELTNMGYNMHRVEIYETPDNCAIYTES